MSETSDTIKKLKVQKIIPQLVNKIVVFSKMCLFINFVLYVAMGMIIAAKAQSTEEVSDESTLIYEDRSLQDSESNEVINSGSKEAIRLTNVFDSKIKEVKTRKNVMQPPYKKKKISLSDINKAYNNSRVVKDPYPDLDNVDTVKVTVEDAGTEVESSGTKDIDFAPLHIKTILVTSDIKNTKRSEHFIKKFAAKNSQKRLQKKNTHRRAILQGPLEEQILKQMSDQFEIDQTLKTKEEPYMQEVNPERVINEISTKKSFRASSEKIALTKTDVNFKKPPIFPYTVSIQKKGSHYSSGALVDKSWVITAAIGFYTVRESIKLFRVRLGSILCKNGGVLRPLKSVEIHPEFLFGRPDFDLALLQLAKPIEESASIRPISLPDTHTKLLSGKFLTSYWPRLIVKGKPIPMSAPERLKPNNMRMSTQAMLPNKFCQKLMDGKNITVFEPTFCLKPIVTHHSLCMPDAGAPLVVDTILHGITSGWTPDNCTDDPSPTFFTRLGVSSVQYWVSHILTS